MTFDPSTIRVVAFDLFGTVFDMSNVPRAEIVAYVDHFEKPEWSPLELPASWEFLPPHPDSRYGIKRIGERFRAVTCSNGPLWLTRGMSDRIGIPWNTIVPLEANRVFKPDPRAYMTVCDVTGVPPQSVLMVTANPRLGRKDYGDVEAARAVGMQSVLIRGESDIPDIIALAERLGC